MRGGVTGSRVEDSVILVGSDEVDRIRNECFKRDNIGRVLWRHGERDEADIVWACAKEGCGGMSGEGC